MTWQITKYQAGTFGRCPRVYCDGQFCLPVGLSDLPGRNTVKLFCPRCEELYSPKSRYQSEFVGHCEAACAHARVLGHEAAIDGSFFGTTFPHMLFTVHPHLRPGRSAEKYEPRIYGFKIHPSAHAKQLKYAAELSQQGDL